MFAHLLCAPLHGAQGMSCASATTVGLGVLVDWTALRLVSCGGVVGVVVGLESINLSPAYAKMCVWKLKEKDKNTSMSAVATS